jgi:hypothetical protein
VINVKINFGNPYRPGKTEESLVVSLLLWFDHVAHHELVGAFGKAVGIDEQDTATVDLQPAAMGEL